MRSYRPLFISLVARQAARHKTRTSLTVLSVAFGVAVVVAVRIANTSAIASFNGAANVVAGGTAVEVVSKGEGLDDSMLTYVRRIRGIASVSPMIVGSLTHEATQTAYDFVGIDFVSALGLAGEQSAPDVAASKAQFSSRVFERGRIVLSAGLARRLHARLDQRLTLLAGARSLRLVVGGLLDDASLPPSQRRVIFSDISTAQEALGRIGRVDRIDVIPASGVDTTTLAKRIKAALPKNAALTTPADRAQELGKMISAFQFNLGALAAIALLVGVYLVFNAV